MKKPTNELAKLISFQKTFRLLVLICVPVSALPLIISGWFGFFSEAWLYFPIGVFLLLFGMFKVRVKNTLSPLLTQALQRQKITKTHRMAMNVPLEQSGLYSDAIKAFFPPTSKIETDDFFLAQYNNVPFSISDTHITICSQKNTIAYTGLLIGLSVRDPRRQDVLVCGHDVSCNMNAVTLEDSKFRDVFCVYAWDQIFARRFLTPRVMTTLLDFANSHKKNKDWMIDLKKKWMVALEESRGFDVPMFFLNEKGLSIFIPQKDSFEFKVGLFDRVQDINHLVDDVVREVNAVHEIIRSFQDAKIIPPTSPY